MKTLLIGDIHCGINKNNPIFFKILLEYGEWVKSVAIENNIGHIIFLGDIFDNRNHISLEASDCVTNFFDILKDFNIDICAGNHDCLYNDRSDINSLAPFKNHPNITIHDKVTIRDDIVFAGWGVKLDDIPPCKLFFGHIDVVGYELTKGKISQHGFKGADLMKKVSGAVYTGHYHNSQVRYYDGKPLYYTGSAFPLNWNDANDQKYLYILDTDTLELSKIENNISPKFVYINNKKDTDNIKGNFVSIKITDNDEGRELQKIVELYDPLNVKTTLVEQEEFNLTTNVDEFKLVKIDELMREYVLALEEYDTYEKEQINKILEDLYKKHE